MTVPEGRTHVVVEPNEKTVGRDDEQIQVAGQEMSRDVKLPVLAPNTGGNTTTTTDNDTKAQPCSTPGCQDTSHEYGGTVSDSHSRTGWRAAFFIGAAGTVASVAAATYGYEKLKPLGGYSGFPPSFGLNCPKTGGNPVPNPNNLDCTATATND